MTRDVPVVTIDGPGGAGKGTLCVRLARTLGWHLLDSGALYRLLALAAADAGVTLDDAPALASLAAGLDVSFDISGGGAEPVVCLNGRPVDTAMRTDAAGQGASQVAALETVRTALVRRQRDFRTAPGLVADGRDMGTVIFPDAPLKVFLTASVEERARRRYKQLIDKGLSANLADLCESISARDERDANRKVAPLRPATDAEVLDSTSVDADGVFLQVMGLIQTRELI